MGHIGAILFSYTTTDVPLIEGILESAPHFKERTDYCLRQSLLPGFLYCRGDYSRDLHPDMEIFIDAEGLWVNCFHYLQETEDFITAKLRENFSECRIRG